MDLEKYLASTKEERNVGMLELLQDYNEIKKRFDEIEKRYNEITREIYRANEIVKHKYYAIYENKSPEKIQNIEEIMERNLSKPFKYWEDLATLTYDEFVKQHCL